MCGILGALPAPPEAKFKASLDRLAHRGPDGFGIWRSPDSSVMLGHRRLAILDLSEAGNQPMQRGRFWLTFNGEIYNYLEIKAELSRLGHSFITDSDSEVLLAAFEQWGTDCFARFNGMWALAIWDEKEKNLYLSRDRFGKKPLFYSETGQYFVFGSEMKALAPFLPEIRPSDDFHLMAAYQLGYEATDKCLIQGIKRFPAAHFGVYREGKLKIQRFWETSDHLVAVPKRYEEQVEAFRELFKDACRLRLRSDVPTGTALSGGVDSSAVFSTIAQLGASSFRSAFVASLPGTPLDETPLAQKVARNAGVEATLIQVDPVSAIERFGDYFYFFEEIYQTNPAPMVETYRAMRQNGVVVTLDGHGADELFCGYDTFLFNAFKDCGLHLGRINNILSAYRGLAPDDPQFRKAPVGFKNYLQWVSGWPGLRYFRPHLLGEIRKALSPSSADCHLNSALYQLFHTDNLPTLMRNYDRYAMASGVEIRAPFLDHRVVSFCFSIPWDSKIRNGYTKALLRDAVAPYAPHDVIYRKTKMGFQTPIVNWLQGPWRAYFLDLIHSTDFENSGLINPKQVRDDLLEVIHNPNATYRQGELAYATLAPFLWEKFFFKRI